MDRRNLATRVAGKVQSTILLTGNTPESVAEATNLSTADVKSRLDGTTPFTIGELLRVGGFLHVPADSFLSEAR